MRTVELRLLRQDPTKFRCLFLTALSHPWLPGIRKYAAISITTIERTLSSSLCPRINRRRCTRLIHHGLELAGPQIAQQVHGHPTRPPRLFSHSSYPVTTGRLFYRLTIKIEVKTTSYETHLTHAHLFGAAELDSGTDA